MIALDGKKIIVTGMSKHLENPVLLFLVFVTVSRTHDILGGGRGIGLAICTAIIEAGGHVGILDLLTEPHPDCRALVEKSGRCYYFTYVAK